MEAWDSYLRSHHLYELFKCYRANNHFVHLNNQVAGGGGGGGGELFYKKDGANGTLCIYMRMYAFVMFAHRLSKQTFNIT